MKTKKSYGKKIDSALTLWVKLARAHLSVQKKVSENILSLNYSEPQFGALECLGHLGALPIGTVGSKKLVSGGNMTLVMDTLEQGGLVERIHSKEDRRSVIVQLTPKGEETFKEVFAKHSEFLVNLFSVLNEKEIDTLAALLKKLGTSIEGIEEKEEKEITK
ncbi:MAG: MarR family transcriptional regulator [Desulfobulbaceae bacterium]|nr:MarR family transcriptional regulator [Desulfobulbaceae bacterium]